jgi:hypothetical protein
MTPRSCLLLAALLIAGASVVAADSAPGFRMQLDTLCSGYDGKTHGDGLFLVYTHKGADHSVYAARILWDKPNADWNLH